MKNTFKEVKRKLILSAIVLFFAFISTVVVTYAYWVVSAASVTEIVNNNSVTVGTGEAITISITPTNSTTETRKLVPAGFGEQTDPIAYFGDTESFVVTYSVIWNDDAALDGVAAANISASVSNILVNSVANPSSLIFVTPDAANPTTIALNGTVTFTFTVTMTEPANKAEYDAVAGLPITFDVTFLVTPNLA